MVLEEIFFPSKAEQRPLSMLFVGMLYSSVAVLLSLWIFEKQSSFIMVFFTVMACIPLIYNTMRLEENKDMVIEKESILLHEHNKAIAFFTFLFLGMVISFVLWYVFLPADVTGYLFEKQTQTITQINNQVSGNAVSSAALFGKIFFNNMKVLSFSVLFSFIYGAGAIFILTWNASVIAAAIGNFIRSHIASLSATTGFTAAASYFQIFSMGFLRYMLHGIPEILAYFYGGLAGGIISIAVMRHHYSTKKFANIVLDTSELLVIAMAFLLIGALFEVYLTPLLF